MRVNINSLDSLELRRLLGVVGGEGLAEARAAALLDWRDVEDVQRAGGAERAWYREHGRLEPRNRALRSWPELEQVRGFERFEELRPLVAFEDEAVSMLEAPVEVISAIAGEDPVVLAHLLRVRGRAGEARAINDLFWSPDSALANRLLAALPALSTRLTLTPAFWRVIAQVRAEDGLLVRVEHHWVRTRDEVVLRAERLR